MSADVTIVEEASEFIQRFVHQRGALPLITSCCPSWTDFMETYAEQNTKLPLDVELALTSGEGI